MGLVVGLIVSFCGAGLIPDIIDAFPDVEICGSKVALMYLKGLTNRDFKQHPVKGGDKIELGKGMYAACSFDSSFTGNDSKHHFAW